MDGTTDNITPSRCLITPPLITCTAPWAVEFPLGVANNNINNVISGGNDFTVSFWYLQRNTRFTVLGFDRNKVSLFGRRPRCGPRTGEVFFDIRSRFNTGNNSWDFFSEIREDAPQPYENNSVSSTGNFNNNCWVHYTITRQTINNQTTSKVYINGTLSATEVYPNANNPNGVADIDIALTYVSIGGLFVETKDRPLAISGSGCIGTTAQTDGTQPFDGFFDEMRVYNRALTDLEATQLHHTEEPHLNPNGYVFCQGNIPPIQVNFDDANIAAGCLSAVWSPTTGVSNPNILEPVINTNNSAAYTVNYHYALENPGAGSCHQEQLTIVRNPNLTVTKTVNSPTVSVGGLSTYTITVVNNGSVPVNNVLITDILPNNLLLHHSGSFNFNTTTNTLTQTVNIPGNGQISSSFTVLITGPTCQNNRITNCATVSFPNSNCSPIQACANLTTNSLAAGPGIQFPTFSAAIAAGHLQPSGSTQNVTLWGTMLLDITQYEFGSGSLVFMAPGARIIVPNKTGLVLTSTTVRGCDSLWRSITIEVNGTVKTDNSNISDAQYAIEFSGNGHLSSTATNYTNNFIGIYYPPIQPDQLFQLDLLNNNIFSSTAAGIRTPYAGIQLSNPPALPIQGEYSLAGIWAHNVARGLRVSAGNNQGVIDNTFRNQINGIVAFESNALVNNARFLTLAPRFATSYSSPLIPKGVGVFAAAPNSNCRLEVEGFGNASSSVSNFFDCRTAIDARAMNVWIHDSYIDNVDAGIFTAFCQNRQILVYKNRINASLLGLLLQQNDPTLPGILPVQGIFWGTSVFDNNITIGAGLNPTSNPGLAGIMINENGALHVNYIFRNDIDIHHAQGGIVSLGSLGTANSENIIQLHYDAPYNLVPDKDGIFAGGGFATVNSCNDISLNSPLASMQRLGMMRLFGQDIDGIQMFGMGSIPLFNSTNVMLCNQVNGTFSGIRFDGVNDFTNQVVGNRFENNFFALNIPLPGGSCGPQTNTAQFYPADRSGNRFVGTIPPILVTPFGAREAFLNPVNPVSGSLFWVNPMGNPNSPFIPNPVTPSGWFVPQLGSNYNCNANGGTCLQPVPFAPPPVGSVQLSVIDTSVAMGQYVDAPDFYAASQWQASHRLYRKLMADTTLAPPGTPFRSFCNSTQPQSIGQFYDLQQQQQQMMELDAANLATWINDRLQLSALQDSLSDLDSIIALTAPALQAPLLAQKTVFEGQLLSVAQQIRNHRSLIQNNRDNAAIAATAFNQTVLDVLPIESYEKIINEIYLATIAKGIYTFTSAQEQTLLQIAAACPLEGGRSVFRARALLGPSLWTDWDDISACFIAGNKAKLLSEEEPQIKLDPEFNIYPNPATHQVMLNWAMDNIETELSSLVIHNAMGQEVARFQNLQDNFLQINTSEWPAGVYYCSLSRKGKSLITKKLIIIR